MELLACLIWLVVVLFGVLLFVLNIVATVSILSMERSLLWKVVWLVIVWVLEPFGMIAYFLVGKNSQG